MAEDLIEITNRHAYWRKKLGSMQGKLDKVEQHRDALQEETESLKGEVKRLQSQIETDDAAYKEVTRFRNQEQLLYYRDKTLLEKNQADLFAETNQSQKLLSELEESTKKFLHWNSLLESQDPKDTYIRHLIEDSSNFYLRRFEVISEPEANRRLREVSESLEQLNDRVSSLTGEIRAASRKKESLQSRLERQQKNIHRKTKLEKEVDALERRLYTELRRSSCGRNELAREVKLLEVQLQEMTTGSDALEESKTDAHRGQAEDRRQSETAKSSGEIGRRPGSAPGRNRTLKLTRAEGFTALHAAHYVRSPLSMSIRLSFRRRREMKLNVARRRIY